MAYIAERNTQQCDEPGCKTETDKISSFGLYIAGWFQELNEEKTVFCPRHSPYYLYE